jgi:serine/threonine-protein kinase
MCPTTPPGNAALTPELIELLEAACDHFEAAWKASGRPALEDYLATMPAEGRMVLVRELVAIELAYRRRGGGRPEPEEYRARYPEWVAAVDAAFATVFDRADRLAPAPDPEATTDLDQPGAGPSQPLPAGTGVRPFGDYELEAVLGEGGMGVVYRGRQISLNRPVAVKMIRAGLWAGDDEVRRFRNEAEAVAALDHPRIVPIYEIGARDGQHYFSMKLLGDRSLAADLARYAADPGAAARLVAVVARAVHHAHQRGILHRDLKPSNILLDVEGNPHVTDFGVARKVEGDGSLSLSGAAVGTQQYMSPEQAAGTRRGVTTATDVCGLGAILYACLTGKPPFQGESMLDTLAQVRERPPELICRLNSRVPRDLEVICLKCLEKDPRRRYDSAAALADELERFERREPILARRTVRLERAVLWARRRPTAAALLALSVVTALVLVGGAVGLWYDLQLRDAHRDTRAALVAESRARVQADQSRVQADQARLQADQARGAEEGQRRQTEAALGREQQTLYFNRVLLAERE